MTKRDPIAELVEIIKANPGCVAIVDKPLGAETTSSATTTRPWRATKLSPMRESDLQRLLNQTAKAARRHQALSQRVTTAFEERYGTTHSAVDTEGIIDALEYGTGEITVEECDAQMTKCGFPPRM